MEAKKLELRNAALGAAVAMYGATEAMKENLEKTGITSALKNFGAGPPPHGLSSNTMALITTNCAAMRSLTTKWP